MLATLTPVVTRMGMIAKESTHRKSVTAVMTVMITTTVAWMQISFAAVMTETSAWWMEATRWRDGLKFA